MTENTTQDVEAQPWTHAFAAKSAEAFGAALASDVILEATALNRPIAGRNDVKATMGAASNIYEHLVFTDESINEGSRYLQWKARAFNGVDLFGITILELNDEGEISHIAIHHRPLGAMLRFSNELGNRLTGVIERDFFHRA